MVEGTRTSLGMRHCSVMANSSVAYTLVTRTSLLPHAAGTEVATIKGEVFEQSTELNGLVDGKHHKSEICGPLLGCLLDNGLLRRLCLQ